MPFELVPLLIITAGWIGMLFLMNLLSKNRIKDLRKLKIEMHEMMVLKDRPHIEIDWLYTFLDIAPSSAFVYQQFDDAFKKVNCIVVVSLSQRANIDNLTHSMNHEALHCAIKTCMKNGAIGEEFIIQRMMELSK
jgi:hypothetical protein